MMVECFVLRISLLGLHIFLHELLKLRHILECYLAFCHIQTESIKIRFEIFTVVTMKNCVLLDVTPCGPCKNRRFGGT
jgi:hypothetical protein